MKHYPYWNVMYMYYDAKCMCLVNVKNTSFTTLCSIHVHHVTDHTLVVNIGTIRDTLPCPLHITITCSSVQPFILKGYKS